MYLTISHAKRIRPAATPRVSAGAAARVSAFVMLPGDGSVWLDPPG